MRDEIRPALTPEEWDAARGRLSWQQEMGVEPPMRDAIDSAAAALCNIPVARARRHHALAALALDGQSFGPKREYVEALREAIAHSEGHEVLLPVVDDDGLGEYRTNPVLANLRAALAFIEALLPPE